MTTSIGLAAAAIVLLLGGGFIVLTMLAAGPMVNLAPLYSGPVTDGA